MNGYFGWITGLSRFIERRVLSAKITHEESAHSSRIPPACGLESSASYSRDPVVLARLASHHHRLISALPPGGRWHDCLSANRGDLIRLRSAQGSSQTSWAYFQHSATNRELRPTTKLDILNLQRRAMIKCECEDEPSTLHARFQRTWPPLTHRRLRDQPHAGLPFVTLLILLRDRSRRC